MKKQKKLSNQELIMFCDHMSMVLKAGLTPAAGIDLMLEDSVSEAGKEILRPIADKCNDGCSFPEALKSSGVFPPYALHMMELGNTSGKLDEVMDSLVHHYTREETLAQNIKSAVTYPFLIIFMMLAVIVVLVVKVLPIFQQVFVQLGTGLTGFSRTLLRLGTTLTTYSVVFIGILLLLVFGFFFFSKTTIGRRMFSSFCSRFFLTRGFFSKICSARFASGMAITLSAGLELETSLELVDRLVDNPQMSKKLEKCRRLMEGNENTNPVSFPKALAASNLFNNMYSKMISIGFTTGSVEQVFHKIADNYDNEIENAMNDTVSVLEPTLVILLSVVVCLILLSVIMPLMGIMSSIG